MNDADNAGEVIFNGLYNKAGELGSSIGFMDIQLPRFFNKPKQIWEMLGFEQPDMIGNLSWNVKMWEDVEITSLNDFNGLSENTARHPNLDSPTYETNVFWEVINYEDNTILGTFSNHSVNIEDLFEELQDDQEQYTAQLVTYIIVNESFSIINGEFLTDNRGFLLINNIQIATANNNEPQNYDYDFTPGVYKIEIIYGEGVGGDYARLGFSLLRDEIEGGGSDIESQLLTHPGNPSSPRYWNNIIPKDYDIYNDRYGYSDDFASLIIIALRKILSVNELTQIEEQLISANICEPSGCDEYWLNVIDEALTLNVDDYNLDYNNDGIEDLLDVTILIGNRINNLNTWVGDYYYPVLPNRFDTSGALQNNNIPFGTPGRMWNEDDVEAPITNEQYQDDSLLLNYTSEYIDRGVLEDTSGYSNVGICMNDYRLTYDEKTIQPIKRNRKFKLNKGNDNKAF